MTQDTALGGRKAVRRLLSAGFVDFLGGGLFLAFSAVYFTKVVGLQTGRVGLGIGIAGCAAMVAAVPLGRGADRWGVRRGLVLVHVVRAGGTAAYALVGNWWSFLAVVTIVTVADQTAGALTQALVAELAEGEQRVRVLARYRTVVNLAITIGGPLGGLLAGTGLFRTVILVNAAAYVLVAAAFATLPQDPRRLHRLQRRRPPVERETPKRGLGALRDVRLLSLASLDGVLQLWQPVLNLAFPLWLAQATDVPRAWLGVLYAINTVLALLLQALVARKAATIEAARRCQSLSAVFSATACLTFWLAATHAATIPLFWLAATHATTIPLFCVALALLTAGELTAVPAAWTLSYAIAPDDRRAEYLAAFGMGRSVGRYVLGPIMITGLLQVAGGWTWAALAGLFAAAGVAAPLVTRTPPQARPVAVTVTVT